MKSVLSIPPLPSSKRIKSNQYGNKENESVVNSHKSESNQKIGITSSGNASIYLTSNSTINSPNTSHRVAISSVSSPVDPNYASMLNSSMTANGGTPLRSRVLRMGETVMGLFCLVPPFETAESQQHLKLCEDISHDVDGSSNHLVKWRKALEGATLSVEQQLDKEENAEKQKDIRSNLLRLHKRAASRFFSYKTEDDDDRRNLLAIFLMYAKAQCKYGSRESAGSTYRLIQTKAIADQEAVFYIHLAEYELGEQHSADSISKALTIIDNGLTRQASPMETLLEYKQALLDQKVALPNTVVEDNLNDNSSRLVSSSTIPLLTKSRISRVPRPNRLKSAGLPRMGGAQRVTTSLAQLNEEDEEDENDNDIPNDSEKKVKLEILEKTPPKITKSDISYLLNWNPTGPGGAGSTGSEKDKNVPSIDRIEIQRTNLPSDLDRCDENIRETQTQSTKSQHSSVHSQASTVGSEKRDETNENQIVSKAVETFATETISSESSNAVQDDRMTQCHPEFIPIFARQNVISVNNEPYVKLGVIGKGGSCKVYRTLSRDRQIVAIKKVKLAGMSKKSIEGYANEISLLRRLRGNPAIIQMYDSEVDLQRKAIYLVMELGEVDLNHVLQQQGQQKDGRRNMNFIRLTWQQMLSAVHCIHEERIIHSDLKPANFLFVRGCLKLIDFGIAKAIQRDDTVNIYRESQVGTLNYMSPESILDTGEGHNGGLRMKCGRPSDVWSLGCILYQMCYGKTPFADLNMFQKLQAIVDPKHEVSFPSTIDSAAIDAMKLCLKRKPEDRAPIVGMNGLLNEHYFLHAK